SGSTGKSGGSRKSGSTGEGRGLRHDTRDLDRAVEIAQAREIIDERSEGYGSVLSQGGINLSGGQKQRLSIARALVKNPGIYIFDDSFSALDYRTDLRLRQALVRETAGATVVLVSQRVSTIQQADQIIVLDEGRIMGTGSHQDLMEGCPTYREIAESQSTSNQSESRNQEGIE
ncbi:ATP-binding cassette domain-containing protein, partial [Spirochaeta lutea]|uniref:ATP-binding cassette domain-containing protein n=1 Tax=Spirochaeta lutea TaxID=1480694 RepID=UPI00055C818C